MIIDNPEKFDKSRRKLVEFRKENGVGPDSDRFETESVAQQYSDLLKDAYGIYYKLIRISKDDHGFYPEYYSMQ